MTGVQTCALPIYIVDKLDQYFLKAKKGLQRVKTVVSGSKKMRLKKEPFGVPFVLRALVGQFDEFFRNCKGTTYIGRSQRLF